MNKADIEIPYVADRGWRYRFFEILPGMITWSILFLPFVLSIFNPRLTVFFIIAYILLWFAKAIGLNIRALQGYRTLTKQQKMPWAQMLKDLENGEITDGEIHFPSWHRTNLERVKVEPTPVQARNIVHAIIVATYKESLEVLEPTFEAIVSSDFDMKRVILVLAYEERGGEPIEAQSSGLIDKYRHHFKHAFAVKHPQDIDGEIIGKGGNITYAGRELEKYLKAEGIEPINVVVTTLDADNHPHSKYLAGLSYVYALSPDPLHMSFQPLSIYNKNIWDVPAPMRVIATGNSFWNIILSLRPHMLRNFSSHAQGMQSIIDTNYWSVRTIVEDGHQFWRTYFRYDGKHEVVPIYLPIYQDAVLANGYIKTFKAQFIQLRRWAWGASDVAYVAETGFFKKNKVPKLDLILKFARLLEGHVTWAVAPLILAGSSFIPLIFNPKDYAANQLPHIASRIQTVAMVGIFVTLFISFKTLPPKPKRYKAHRSFLMLAQWALLPFTTIAYGSFAALYSQTRLMFGKYLGKFDFTEKAVVTDKKKA